MLRLICSLVLQCTWNCVGGDITQIKNFIVSDRSYRRGASLWTVLIQKSASLGWNSKPFSENKQHTKNHWFSAVSNQLAGSTPLAVGWLKRSPNVSWDIRHKFWQLTKLMVELMFALFSGDQFCKMFSGRINVEEITESLQSSWNPPMRVV